MKKSVLYALWGGLFSICAGLGFIPETGGILRFLMTALSVACFAPPGVLLYRAKMTGDRGTASLIRNLSALSLGLTLAVLVLNVLCAVRSELLGRFLHAVLTVVSSPMLCSGYWALSLFLWACLMIASIRILKAKKNP